MSKQQPKQTKAVAIRKVAPAAIHQPPAIQPFTGNFTEQQVELVKRTICLGASEDELQLFLMVCQRTQLDPFMRQIYSIARRQFDQASQKWIEIRSIQTSIDGFRLVADRTHKYRGQTEMEWCGKDGVWLPYWIALEAPVAARVGALREGFERPMWGVARFESYVQKTRDGITAMWKRMPEVMIGKCAEALALRKAFPMELSGIYTDDEMAQAENVEPEAPAEPKQIPGSVVETFTVEPEPKAARAPKEKDWRKVESHVGNAGGPMLGKKVGEMVPAIVKWFETDWIPSLPAEPTKKDAALRDAILARIAHDAANPPAPAQSSSAPEPLPEPQKPSGGAPDAKESPFSLETEPETGWRGVVVDLPQSKATNGRTLGAIADAKKGDLVFEGATAKQKAVADKYDGLAWMRMLGRDGIPVIKGAGNLGLIAAIKAACNELGVFDDEAWLSQLTEAEAREEILRRFAWLGLDESAANEHLKEITKDTAIAELSQEMALYILTNWSVAETAIKGDK